MIIMRISYKIYLKSQMRKLYIQKNKNVWQRKSINFYMVSFNQGWTNFFLGAQFFGWAILLNFTLDQIGRLIETQLETLLFAFYYLIISYNLYFQYPKIFAMRLM